jgi:hypothetical protein
VSGASLLFAGCPEVRSHIYVAELYDPDADCLYPGSVLDIVPGPPPEDGAASCDAICISDIDGDTYISAMCPPLPIEFNTSGDSPSCPKAFEAQCRQCPIEGGPIETVCDAGTKDASPDAASDAPRDVASDASADAKPDTEND